MKSVDIKKDERKTQWGIAACRSRVADGHMVPFKVDAMDNSITGQKLAEQWAAAGDRHRDLSEQAERLNRQASEEKRKQETNTKALAAMVGDNVPTRAFRISEHEILLVEHGKGIRRVLVEERTL